MLMEFEHVLVELGLQGGLDLITAHVSFDIRDFLDLGLLF